MKKFELNRQGQIKSYEKTYGKFSKRVIKDYEIYETDRVVIIFEGRKSKSTYRYTFQTEVEKSLWLNNIIANHIKILNRLEKEKKEIKERREKDFKELKIGDIFASSWGYDQTNVNFYQLISLKGKTGTFREIGKEVTSESGYMSNYVKPVKNDFVGDEFKSRITGKIATKVPWSQKAYKVEDTEKSWYQSWYG